MVEASTEQSPEAPMALECSGLTKRFGDATVVNGVSFRVHEGETFALLGPSGCGKTTTLRMLAGLEHPDAGVINDRRRVLFDAKTCVPPEGRGIGLVFQQYALFPHLNVEQNVAFGLKESKAAAQEMLRKVLLDDRAQARIEALSGGEQQRVALARALAPHPSVLLLDEPFANLDASLRMTVRGDVKALLKTLGATAILVTHDQGEAMGLADRIGVMCDGKLLQVGSPRAVYRAPVSLTVANTLGEGNCLPAKIEEGEVVSAVGRLDLVQAVVDGRNGADACTLFVRPEHLALGEGTTADSSGGGEVKLVWFAGSHASVTVRLDSGTEVTVRADASVELSSGDRVAVRVVGDFCLFPRP